MNCLHHGHSFYWGNRWHGWTKKKKVILRANWKGPGLYKPNLTSHIPDRTVNLDVPPQIEKYLFKQPWNVVKSCQSQSHHNRCWGSEGFLPLLLQFTFPSVAGSIIRYHQIKQHCISYSAAVLFCLSIMNKFYLHGTSLNRVTKCF